MLFLKGISAALSSVMAPLKVSQLPWEVTVRIAALMLPANAFCKLLQKKRIEAADVISKGGIVTKLIWISRHWSIP